MIFGDKENTVTAIANGPAIANPEFAEIQSTDQTSGNASFRTKIILKRPEKPENSIDSKIEDFDYYCKITRSPRMPVLSKSIIIVLY